ncbi:Alpha-L-fucosidase [Planctomycetes bacterium CA13]|uniref:alpha-L-fucosidase n=1 Tax=Novipirellula herctigrandis TaxID=2527986 RepID=A0A5C5YLI3_9BACT|nr:Alpha-L-fucosidase [Planctomycetes bacterium CA13]
MKKRISLLLFSLFVATTIPTLAQEADETPDAFQPNWKSLEAYQCPEWFQDAKFGIYAHWGPYVVPAHKSEWYSHYMYFNYRKRQEEVYGPLKDFGYKDFIPDFTGEKFDAQEWAKLYKRAGAKFAGPVAEHADGFTMWDSELTEWDSMQMGPKRDVVGELEKAVREQGMKFVTTFHHQWLWGWYPTYDETTDASDPKYSGLYGPKVEKGQFTNTAVRDKPFCQLWQEKVDEVVEKYHPDMIWFDTRTNLIQEPYRLKMAANFYNSGLEDNRDVILTYKNQDMMPGTGTFNMERSRMREINPDPWQTDTSIASNSWGYVEGLKYYSTQRLLQDLVDIVSKNGCVLLNIAPRADGTIPQEQVRRLHAMGDWLNINGEAIYATRPWKSFGEGPAIIPEGHLADLHFEGFSAEDIRFTQSKDGKSLYVICLDMPESGKLIVKSLGSDAGLLDKTPQAVSLLGSDAEIEWESDGEAMTFVFPEPLPCDHLYAFKIKL